MLSLILLVIFFIEFAVSLVSLLFAIWLARPEVPLCAERFWDMEAAELRRAGVE
jgi:hypothetical protein